MTTAHPILDLITSLVGNIEPLPEVLVKELLLELECGEILRKSSFLSAYEAMRNHLKPSSDLSERSILALSFFGLALSDTEVSGEKFEKNLTTFYEVIGPKVNQVGDKNVVEAVLRLLVELKIQACLYHYEDKEMAGDDHGAAVDLRDAIERLLPVEEEDDDDDNLLNVELKCRADALRSTFTNFRSAALDRKAFEVFRNKHVIEVVPDVMKATKHLVRFLQNKIFGPVRLRPALAELAGLNQQQQKKKKINSEALEAAQQQMGLASAIKLRETSQRLKREIEDPLEDVIRAPKRLTMDKPREEDEEDSAAALMVVARKLARSMLAKSGAASPKKAAVAVAAAASPKKAVAAAAPSPQKAVAAAASPKKAAAASPNKTAAASPKKTAAATPKKATPTLKKKTPSKRKSSDSTNATLRIKFTPQEDAALLAGVKKFGAGNWKAILEDNKDVFSSVKERSTVDLKDKYRYLKKTQAIE